MLFFFFFFFFFGGGGDTYYKKLQANTDILKAATTKNHLEVVSGKGNE
jgi:hypothetical protein